MAPMSIPIRPLLNALLNNPLRFLKLVSWVAVRTLPFALCLLTFAGHTQVTTPLPVFHEELLEAATENNADVETEDDSFLQFMRQFLKDPINLNSADVATLKELMIFSPIQLSNLISYRKLLGNFISIYELQAVPGFDLQFIHKIRLYVTISGQQNVVTSVGERLRGGTSTIVARVSQVLEEQKGFKPPATPVANHYPGSPQRLFVRYKYQYKNLLQYGVVGEKDAGEQFFKGAQKTGFDFYSAHFFVRNIGMIKSAVIGDFTVNLGQGLTQWQSLAFKKSADVVNIKRQLDALRPYNSAGEINFHRGIGISVAKNNIGATAFVSLKRVDANFATDTMNIDGFISSFQTSGLHRTKSETDDKGVQRQFTVGGNLVYNSASFHFGINGVHYQFKLPVNKGSEPYNLYAISGKSFSNYSVDYSYTYRNLHLFGEAAFTGKLDKAFVNGLIISADPKVDLSFLYRNIPGAYQTLYTNAFTENASPNNEKGLYGGISIRPNSFWRIDAFADFYKFPWLKYQVDAASLGTDYLLQAFYKPNKQMDLYVRYRTERKLKNFNPYEQVLSPVLPKPKQSLRSQVNCKINGFLTLRNRVEMNWFDKRGEGHQTGFLTLIDFIINPMMKRYSGSVRLQYFETEGYDSRMYAYENDVLYSFSIPVFYDKGYRYYINLNYAVSKKLTVWLRFAQSIFPEKAVIGSGLDEIAGNKRTEVKMQVQYQF